ncbi:MAG TPA: peptidyl-prolyl cis-trans isomerase [Armatimonadota bacterium]|nr:peptidyl-prolyl cis-trans isomerase [Armatimonadota bacterium]
MLGRRLALITAAGLLAALVLSGCGRDGGTFVSINGEKISKDEFYNRLEKTPIPGSNVPIGQYVLDQMIDEKLIVQMAKEKKVEPTEAQIKRQLDRIKKDGKLSKLLNQRQITIEEYKKELYVRQAEINIVSKGVKIPDKDVKAFYDEKKSTLYTKPETVEIGAVVCKTEEKIKKADQQIKGGTEFSTVAMNLSDDEIAKRSGGKLGPVWRGRAGVPDILVDAAFKLKVGQCSEPFKVTTQDGPSWVIVKALDRKSEVVQPYNEVKDSIHEMLAFNEGQKRTDVTNLIAKRRESAKIDIKDKKYSIFSEKDKDKKSGDKKK